MNELPGNGIFESLKSTNNNIFRFDDHFQRLCQSAKAVGIKPPIEKKIKAAISKELSKANFKNAYVRVSVSRENAIEVLVKPFPVYPGKFYTDGVGIMTVPDQRNAASAVSAEIKSCNFQAGVLAKAVSRDSFEAVFLNADGYVTEGTVSNIFIVQPALRSLGEVGASIVNRKTLSFELSAFSLRAPPSYLGALSGITKKVVIEICEKTGILVEERPFTRYNLYNADECFLTNTSIGVMPVVKADGRAIGEGRPGLLTKKLMRAFRGLTGQVIWSLRRSLQAGNR